MRVSMSLMVLATLWAVPGCGQPTTTESPVAEYVFELPPTSAVPTFELPLTIPQAYRAIPHKRTEFDPTYSKVPEPERAYLTLMFRLVDEAVAVRVSALRAFSSGDRNSAAIEQYETLINFVETIEPPPTLSQYHSDLRSALQVQQAFFKDWRTQGSGFAHKGNGYRNHPQVKAASGHLISAHQQLVQAFPHEDSVNKDAFFDHHCALDFI
ncbi:MAG: hypothetical protein AB8B99_22075 [Phormidesmis sp.]